jgi:cytochrome c-type biogenesis protein CcmH/NrfG
MPSLPPAPSNLEQPIRKALEQAQACWPSEPSQAFGWLERAQVQAQLWRNDVLLGETLLLRGRFHYYQADYRLALAAYSEAYALAGRSHDAKQLSVALNGQGIVYLRGECIFFESAQDY